MSHRQQGATVGPEMQLSALARILAADVFPTPRAPANKYACPTRCVSMALVSARTTWSCPTRSSNVWGRYRRAMTRYGSDGDRWRESLEVDGPWADMRLLRPSTGATP